MPWLSPPRRRRDLIVRIAAYNIEADTNGNTAPNAGLYQVIEGIGEEQDANANNIAQPVDILALEETTSNAATVAPIVSNLNTYYNGAAVYAQSPVQGGQNGSPTSGNGPNALVYNTLTTSLVSSVGVGTPTGSGDGEYRQVMRYEFQPLGGSPANDFYVYVTHMKADSGYTDENDRAEEAAIIRANEATLPASASVLYMGDFNCDGNVPVTKTGSPSVSAILTMSAAGQGQAIDPLNPSNQSETWTENATFASDLTEENYDLRYRDDLELMTQNVYGGTSSALNYVSGSLHAFGNNGSIGVYGTVDSSANIAAWTNIPSNAPISASTIAYDLTTASDHCPIVADYQLGAVPEPGALALLLAAAAMLPFAWQRRRRRREEN